MQVEFVLKDIYNIEVIELFIISIQNQTIHMAMKVLFNK